MSAMRFRMIWLAITGLLVAGYCQAANDAEKKAIKAIENLGGKVGHRKLIIGDVVINVVTEVNLAALKVTDEDLKHLAALKQLRTLDLLGTQVTDAGLKELAALKQLQTLNLGNTQVTDAGVAELRKELPKCRISR